MQSPSFNFSSLLQLRDNLRRKIICLQQSSPSEMDHQSKQRLVSDLKRDREQKQNQLTRLIGSVRFERAEVQKGNKELGRLNKCKKELIGDRISLIEGNKDGKKGMEIKEFENLSLAKEVDGTMGKKKELVLTLADLTVKVERETGRLELTATRCRRLKDEIESLESTNNTIQSRIALLYEQEEKNIGLFLKSKADIGKIGQMMLGIKEAGRSGRVDQEEIKCNLEKCERDRVNFASEIEMLNKKMVECQMSHEKQLAEFKRLSLENREKSRQRDTILQQLGNIQNHKRVLQNTNTQFKSTLGQVAKTHLNYSKAHSDLMRTTADGFKRERLGGLMVNTKRYHA